MSRKIFMSFQSKLPCLCSSSALLRIVFFSIFQLSIPLNNFSQEKFTIIPCETEEDVINIVDTIFLKGLREKGFVSNIQFVGAPESVGRFYHGDSTGFARGIIMTTGSDPTSFEGPNNIPVSTDYNSGYKGDPDMFLLTGHSTQAEISHIEFDFIPSSDHISFNYIWGSDSYSEVTPHAPGGSFAQEAFAFFCSGPTIDGPFSNDATNLALLPNKPPDKKSSYVTLLNLHCGQESDFMKMPPGKKDPPEGYYINCEYLIWNNHFPGTPYADCYSNLNCYTIPFTAERKITPCETYHLKLIISDNGGNMFDAAVLLEANSFDIGEPKVSVNYTRPFIPQKILHNCNDAEVRFELQHEWEEEIKIPVKYEQVVVGEDILKDDATLYAVDTIRIPPGIGYGVTKIKSLKPALGEGDFVRIRYPRNTCTNFLVEKVDVPFGSYEPISVEGLVNGVNIAETTELNVGCESDIAMQANAQGGFAPYSYKWEYIDSKPDPANPGSFLPDPKSITQVDGNFIARFPQDIQLQAQGICQSPAEEEIKLLIDGLSLEITPESQEVCPGTKLTLTAITDGEVTWSIGATSHSIEVEITADITYSCSVLNNCTGDLLTESVSFTVIKPTAHIDGKTELCPGETSSLSANEGISYQWSTGQTTQEINIQPTQDMWYKVQVENTCGDFARDSVWVSINTSVIADAGEDQASCQGTEITLYGDGGESVEWWNVTELLSTERELKLTPESSMQLILIAKGICTDQDTIDLIVHPNPQIELEDIQLAGCVPAEVEIRNLTEVMSGEWRVVSGEKNLTSLTSQWFLNKDLYSSDKDFKMTIHEAGTYDLALKVSTDFGCTDSLNMPQKLTAYANPQSDIISDDYPEYFTGKTYYFTAEDLQDDWIYEWLVEGQSNPNAELNYEFKEAGNFQLTLNITDQHNCFFSKTIEFEVKLLNTEVFIPTAFSPNGDGLNDEFYITASNLKEYQCHIFNRWGQQIYHNEDINQKWDGRVGGDLVDAGAYVVKIRYEGADGIEQEYKGMLVVVR